MAISNLQLNVRANTARALADFNKFSRSLDNKFLVSGLKLDVITSALGRINRDFQRAIGEQGIASASSLRAAQNQAALLTQTFKGFADESAMAITRQIGTALNTVAVTAGGTMKDVQKTLAATPFISTRISEDLRGQLSEGILRFQRDMRRGGIGENFAGVAQQFLMGRATGMQLVETGNPLESFLGKEIMKRTGGEGFVYDPADRSRLILDIVNDPQLQKQLTDMARSAMGYRIFLEDLNTNLFNPEKGVFGSLRKVVDAAGKPTTMFDEVEKLVKQVFDRDEGLFAIIGKRLQEIFGIKDPLRPFIDGVQLVTRGFEALTNYLKSSGFDKVVKFAKDIFDRVYGVFRDIFNAIRGMSSSGLDEDSIIAGIRDIGTTIREYIRNIGEKIRGTETTDETGAIAGIAGTVLEEIGKSAVVLFKELLMTIINKVPEIAMQVLPALNDGINAILTEMFGELGGKVAKFVLGFIPGVGPLARASAAGDITGGGGNMLSMLAMGASALLGPKALFGAAKLGRGFLGPDEARMNLLRRVGGIEEIYNRRARELYMPGAQRSPISGFLSRFLSPRTSFASVNPNFFESVPNPNYYPSSPLPPGGIIRPGTRMAPPFINPMGMVIGPETSMFEAIPGFFEQERTRRESAIRGNRERSAQEGMERYRRSLASYRAETSAFRFYNVPEYLTRDPIDFTAYDRPIGPQPHGANWAYAPEYGGIGGEYAPFMESSYTSPRERETQRRLAASERYKRMYESGSLSRMSRRSRISSIASRFRPGKRVALGLGAAGIVSAMTLLGGPGAKAQTFDPATGQMVPVAGGGGGLDLSGAGSVLSGGFEGATIGATIGSVVPGIGTAAGAVIGGIIGGIAPLMDEGVKKSFEKMLSDIGTRFSETADWFSKGFSENFTKFSNFLGEMLKGLGNALVFAINASISAFTLMPRLIITTVEALFNRLPEALKPDWAKGAISGIKSITSFQLPYFYGGKDYYGPSLALEAQMSGRRPMVVNDGEFVIPKDGFATLAGLVSQNVSLKQPAPQGVNVQVSLSVTANSVVADADELANTLREPVYRIINDAWYEATAGTVSRARTS